MTDLALFDMTPTAAEPIEKLSADRRRTIRQREAIERGLHPLGIVASIAVRRPLRVHEDERRTCGNCRFRQRNAWGYPKCVAYDGARATHGTGTDVRASWPACTDHEWSGAQLSDDAARWVPDAAS